MRFLVTGGAGFLGSHLCERLVARIFNTYGPRQRSGDGRAVPTFIGQTLLAPRPHLR